MIVQRAIAEYLAALYDGLHAFKDDLAWAQQGSPFPYLMITRTGLTRRADGTGTWDERSWDRDTAKWVFTKTWVYTHHLRLTIRSAPKDTASGATICSNVSRAIEDELCKYGTGIPLALVDTLTGTAVHVRRVIHRGGSDQSPNISRAPFDSQVTLGYQFEEVRVVDVSREIAFGELKFEDSHGKED